VAHHHNDLAYLSPDLRYQHTHVEGNSKENGVLQDKVQSLLSDHVHRLLQQN